MKMSNLYSVPFYTALLDMELADGSKLSTGHVLYMGAVIVHGSGPLGGVAKNQAICEEIRMSEGRGQNIRADLIKAGYIVADKNKFGEIFSMTSTLSITKNGVKGTSQVCGKGSHKSVKTVTEEQTEVGDNILESYSSSSKMDTKDNLEKITSSMYSKIKSKMNTLS